MRLRTLHHSDWGRDIWEQLPLANCTANSKTPLFAMVSQENIGEKEKTLISSLFSDSGGDAKVKGTRKGGKGWGGGGGSKKEGPFLSPVSSRHIFRWADYLGAWDRLSKSKREKTFQERGKGTWSKRSWSWLSNGFFASSSMANRGNIIRTSRCGEIYISSGKTKYHTTTKVKDTLVSQKENGFLPGQVIRVFG